jgi:hypothetical protein
MVMGKKTFFDMGANMVHVDPPKFDFKYEIGMDPAVPRGDRTTASEINEKARETQKLFDRIINETADQFYAEMMMGASIWGTYSNIGAILKERSTPPAGEGPVIDLKPEDYHEVVERKELPKGE